jgi:hypothetical protein
MSKVGQSLRGYFWWTYPRGSVPYDIMVTIILAFIFITPIWINFRDKPQPKPARQAEVVVQQVGDGFLYKVDATTVMTGNDVETRDSLLRIIEPIAGSVVIEKYQQVRDGKNNVVAYNVWVHR